jgi:hypothetical protein
MPNTKQSSKCCGPGPIQVDAPPARTASTTLIALPRANANLIDGRLWERLVSRIQADADFDRHLAERVMDQALGFLHLCARVPNGQYSPSPMVDIGWHTFILYTRHYAAFCTDLAGDLIHHEPSDDAGVDYGSGNVGRTVVALKAHGIAVDEELWLNTADSCSTYCSGDSCSGGGGSGDPGCQH